MDNNQQNMTGTVNTANTSGMPSGYDNKEELIWEELKKLSKKQVRWHRLSALFMLGILVTLLAVVVVLLPRMLQTLRSIDEAVAQVTESIDDVDAMVAEMTTASKNLNDLVNANAQPLTDAVSELSEVATEMSNIDYEGLNQAIKDFQGAVGPVANFFKKFR